MKDRHAGDQTEQDFKRTKGHRIGTIWWNGNEGDATLAMLFDEMDPIARLDALLDCIGVLQIEYNNQHAKLYGSAAREEKK